MRFLVVRCLAWHIRTALQRLMPIPRRRGKPWEGSKRDAGDVHSVSMPDLPARSVHIEVEAWGGRR